MTSTFVDTSVVLDIATEDPRWAAWSQAQLDAAASRGPALIGDVTYAEVSVGYDRLEDADAVLAAVGLEVVRPSRAALFLAGKAHRLYRRAGGTRTGVLSDFLVGAQAVAEGAPLLTRDARRFDRYFPALRLLSPPRPPTR